MKITPFILLCITGLFAIFSSTISKSPVLPLFATYLNADPSGVGFIASISAFTGIVASIPAGILSDRFGRRKMMLLSAIVFSTAPFLYLAITELWQLALVRFYHGLATAIFIPVAMALVADLFHKERGEKIGWFSTSTLAGRFIAPLAGGSIIGALVFNPGLSFKVVYILCGAAGVTAFILTLMMSKSYIKEKPSIDSARVDMGWLRKDEGSSKHSWGETWKIFKTVISDKYVILTSVVEAAILFAYGTFETFLPLYSLSKGLSAYEIGIFLSAQVITLALTKPLMGRFSDRHGRRPQIFWGAIIGAFCIGGFSFFGSFMPLLALSMLFGLSLSIVTSATSAYIADLSSKESHGSAMGILGSIMDIGHTTGPLISGIIASYFGIEKAFMGASILVVVIAIVFIAGVSIKENKMTVRQ